MDNENSYHYIDLFYNFLPFPRSMCVYFYTATSGLHCFIHIFNQSYLNLSSVLVFCSDNIFSSFIITSLS